MEIDLSTYRHIDASRCFMYVLTINKLIVVEYLQISYVYEMKLKGSNKKYQ